MTHTPAQIQRQRPTQILVFSKYSAKGASSRFRMVQYFDSLATAGIQADFEPLFGDHYLNDLYSGKKTRIFWLLVGYWRRLGLVLKQGLRRWIGASVPDVVWLEKDLLPWVPWGFERIALWILLGPNRSSAHRTRLIVDYDDAVFHSYDLNSRSVIRSWLGDKHDQLVGFSDHILPGNSYLASKAIKQNTPYTIVPTVVSKNIYRPRSQPKSDSAVPVIGWIGSPSTATYLEIIRPVLKSLREAGLKFSFHVVGAKVDWPELDVKLLTWSESAEVGFVQDFDIGVMPLLDSPWEKGKCGFKLIQYMACGLPVVASPVGVNSEIVIPNLTGFLALTQEEWGQRLRELLSDPNMRQAMGQAGRQRFENDYALEKWSPVLASVFKSCD